MAYISQRVQRAFFEGLTRETARFYKPSPDVRDITETVRAAWKVRETDARSIGYSTQELFGYYAGIASAHIKRFLEL